MKVILTEGSFSSQKMYDDEVKMYASEFVDVLPKWYYYAAVAYLGVVCLAGAIINGTVLLIFTQCKSVSCLFHRDEHGSGLTPGG